VESQDFFQNIWSSNQFVISELQFKLNHDLD